MIDLCLRYGANGVPILSNNGIDSQAEALIADYDPSLLKTPRALDVDDFIENYIGLRLHYTYLSHKGFIWGRMVFHNTKIIVFDPVKNCANEEAVDGNTIVIDNRLLDEKKEHALRSTAMHECCHAVYHFPYFCLQRQPAIPRQPYTSCEAKNIVGPDRNSGRLLSDIDWIEHQAKYFSAAILMPRKPLVRLCKSTFIRYGISENYLGNENDALAAYVAKLFNVSCESARIRIRQLGLEYKTKPRSTRKFFCNRNLSVETKS